MLQCTTQVRAASQLGLSGSTAGVYISGAATGSFLAAALHRTARPKCSPAYGCSRYAVASAACSVAPARSGRSAGSGRHPACRRRASDPGQTQIQKSAPLDPDFAELCPLFSPRGRALGDGAARTQRAAVRAADHAMDAASEPRRRVHRAHHLHQLACEPSFASSGLQARKRRNFSDLCPAFTTASAVRSALQLGRQNATMARPESPGVARTGLITCDSCPASPHLPPAGCRLATGATIAICSRRSRRRLQAGCLPLPVCAQSGRRRHYRPSVAATCRGKAVDWAVCELHGGGDKLILGKGDTLSCLLSLGPPLWRAAAAGLCQRGEHRATLLQVRSHHHLASLPHAAELSAAAVAATVPVQKMAVNVRSRLAARA